MKLSTAIRIALEIRAKIRSVNGLLGTPDCSCTAMRIRRAWVFGSTVKGSAAPGDVDILIELHRVGRQQSVGRGAKLCKDSARRHGYRVSRSPEKSAVKWLRGNLKKVSFHALEEDGRFAWPRVMIYPRNDLDRCVREAPCFMPQPEDIDPSDETLCDLDLPPRAGLLFSCR